MNKKFKKAAEKVSKIFHEEERIECVGLGTHDPVNRPHHYTNHPSGVECIEITRHMTFNLGNAIKYIWRSGKKDKNKTIEDLKKAIFYINDEIDRLL